MWTGGSDVADRSGDWIEQAARDLETARWAAKGDFHEWACFIAQQAAEKAVKALYHRNSGEARGHSVMNLLKGLKDRIEVPDELLEAGRNLDRYYIPARYPNGWDEGTPGDYHSEKDSGSAIAHSEEVIRFCQGLLA
jgi:HEPN domain-containing protein